MWYVECDLTENEKCAVTSMLPLLCLVTCQINHNKIKIIKSIYHFKVSYIYCWNVDMSCEGINFPHTAIEKRKRKLTIDINSEHKISDEYKKKRETRIVFMTEN
jgi:hypothetical protein